MVKTMKRKSNNKPSGPKKRTRYNRSVKRHPILLHTDDGQIRDVTYKDSTWYCLYISSPPEGKRLNNIFDKDLEFLIRNLLKLLMNLSKTIYLHDGPIMIA